MQEQILWQVMENYNLTTSSIAHYYRDVYKVETDQGPKALKLCDRDEKKLVFIFSIMQHVWEKGYKKISKPIATKDGKACVVLEGKVFFLADWVEGRKCDFGVLNDLLAACASMAEFHSVSYGLKEDFTAETRLAADKWEKVLSERLKDLIKFKEIAVANKTPFIERYLTSCDYFIKRAEEANKILAESNYDNLAKQAIENSFFTHRDVAGRNFIMVGKEAYLIDFDYARYDIRVTDIVRLFERGIRMHDWSPKVGKKMLEVYNKHSKYELSEDEYVVIFAFLTWPQKYWRICYRYFNNKRNWQEERFIQKLGSLTNQLSKKDKFLLWFRKEYC